MMKSGIAAKTINPGNEKCLYLYNVGHKLRVNLSSDCII